MGVSRKLIQVFFHAVLQRCFDGPIEASVAIHDPPAGGRHHTQPIDL